MAAAMFCEIDQFNLDDEHAKSMWEEWCERLDQFFIANGLDKTRKDDKPRCKAIFLAKVGGKCYSLIRTLCHPDKPSSKTLADLQKLVKNHLSPAPIVIAERYVFYNKRQTADESVAEFQNTLRKLAETCDFGDFRNEALRDMFVIGLRDRDTQKRLLGEDNLTLETAFARAQAAERTKKHVDDMTGEVHKLQMSGKKQNISKANLSKGSRACYFCNEEGHFKAQCPKRLSQGQSQNGKHKYKKRRVNKVNNAEMVEASSSDCESDSASNALLHAVRTIGKVGETVRVPQYLVQMQVNGKPLDMEIDTGASVSIVSHKQFKKLGLGELIPSDISLSTITGEKLTVVGKCLVSVVYHEQTYTNMCLYVVESRGSALLGRDWLSKIQIDWNFIKSLQEGKPTDRLIQRYSSLFDGQLGRVSGIEAKLELKDEAKPKFCKPRVVPSAVQEPIEKELRRLVENKVLRKLDYSEWAAPIVPVKKPSGDYRICGDYSVTVNKYLKIPEHPMPNIEELLAKLNGGEKFSKLDLSQAYQQVQLSPESQSYVAINTHMGLYTYTRVPYGISAAPSLFQSVMDRVLQGIKCGCYLDDIVVTGKDDQEHLENLEKVFARLNQYGFKLQKSKCELMKSSIHYLGHVVEKRGISKDSSATEAIREAPAPRNKGELRSFLGLVNQYRKFVSNLSTIAAPLNELLQDKVRWDWSIEREQAFTRIKESIIQDTVLAHYDPRQEVYLAVDASPVGLGAVITHGRGKDERPIAFGSRTLTQAERNYSQIDREALAIIYGIKKFHYYLYGRKFILYTDNQPLCHILGSRKGLPSLAAARILRWAIELADYNFEVRHRPGSKNCCADALSRLPVNIKETSSELVKCTTEAYMCNMNTINSLPVTAKQIARHTRTDGALSKVMLYVRTGWPSEVGPELSCYFQKRTEISVEEDCLLWGSRVIIPEKLRDALVEELHQSHQGIVKMKALARLHCWWPNLDKDIEQQVKQCSLCQHNQDSPPKLCHNSWAWPNRPWARVHVDFAQYEGDYYLVMVDAYSKWAEVIFMQKSTTAVRTIEAMRSVFARLGLCEQIVADNGPPFRSKEFQEFLSSNGIKAIYSAPYHPASNGLAERFVKTLKRGLKKSTGKSSKLHTLYEFLLLYRSTPHSVTGQPPSELLFGRRIRTRLDLVRPDLKSKITRRTEGVLQTKLFSIGDRVLARDYRNVHKPGWMQGVIVSKSSPVTYDVQVELRGEFVIWKRHIDQLIELGNSLDVSDNVVVGENKETVDNAVVPVVGDSEINVKTEPQEFEYDITTGGRAPYRPPRPEVAVTEEAESSAVVGSDTIPERNSETRRQHPTRERHAPSHLRTYECY